MDSLVTPARIVVVEDDARMGRALQRYLRREGHLVTRVSSGSALRRACRENPVDLVLLDLNLGSEDGLDLARELLRSTGAAVIIVTGRVDLQDRITGLDAGADDYVTKPFDPEELLARVRAVLRRHSVSTPPRTRARVGPSPFHGNAGTHPAAPDADSGADGDPRGPLQPRGEAG